MKQCRDALVPAEVRERAKPLKGNEPPPYPKNAQGQSTVTIKIRISATGEVEEVRPVDGEEPFLSAAIQTVKHWRYEPPTHQGKPISEYRTVKIAFDPSMQ